jgi:hypothetical protein
MVILSIFLIIRPIRRKLKNVNIVNLSEMNCMDGSVDKVLLYSLFPSLSVANICRNIVSQILIKFDNGSS